MPVVAIAGEDEVNRAIQAMRLGAADCISQPIDPEIASNGNIYNLWTLGLATGGTREPLFFEGP